MLLLPRHGSSSGAAGATITTEYRVRHKDGRWLHVEDRAVILKDAGGKPVKLVGCTVDVTDRKRAEEEVRRLNDELRHQLDEINALLDILPVGVWRADKDCHKDEFIATLAHELRNPLAPIRNAVQVLQLKGPPDPELVWGRDVIERQVGQMSRLLEDLLDVSRITRNKLELRKERVELAAAIRNAEEISRPVIDGGGHELSVALPSEPVFLDADPVRLAQVFGNLLNNAGKYTERGGHIRLTAERDGGEVVVRVADDGIGIPPELLPRMFEMFSQAASALERSQGGLGIGLSLVKGLVEMHGGTVTAHSEGPGRGSEFAVRLPVLADTKAEPPPAAGATPPAAGRRILVVDDNRDSAASLAMLLKITGNETLTAHDGLEAVEKASAFRPDVILLDIGLPKLNGYEACRRIRGEPWGKGILLVALTGWGQDEDRRRSKEAGFDGHLVKPVDYNTLTALLAESDAAKGSTT